MVYFGCNNMANTLVASNGNDVVMTPPQLGQRIIQYLNPTGKILEPCKGDGMGFLQFIPNADWCEITQGVDFFEYHDFVDWIITNPPYSQLLKFMQHSFEISNTVALLILLPNCFQKAKIKLAKRMNFYLSEVIYIDNPPPPFPQFGFQVGVAVYKKGSGDVIKVTDWTK